MEAKFQIFMILLAVLAGTALLARRANIAPAILLMFLTSRYLSGDKSAVGGLGRA